MIIIIIALQKVNLIVEMSNIHKLQGIISSIIFAIFLFVFLSLFLPLASFAQEVINSYSSNIIVQSDGSVEITENIEVKAEGVKIKRGIYRDIPTIMINDDGSNFRTELKVISVKKNGESEPFFTENITNGIRIYIGQSSVFLSEGIYRYIIKYTMTRQVRFFENHDELFWNATGSFWDFPIKKSIARIKLPTGAIVSDLVGFTGSKGSKEEAVKISKTGDNSATFEAMRSLNPYEGMSIAVKFQKGIITEPEGIEETALYITDRKDIIIPIIAAFLVLFYYLYAWFKVGRDPKKGVIIPLFYPPKNFSPALVHYVDKMGWKKDGWSAFTAVLINLGAKGLITIDKKKNSTRIDLTNKRVRDLKIGELPAGEEVIYDLLKLKNPLFLNKKNGTKILKAKKEFVEILGAENRHAYFKNNYIYIILGIIISLIALVVLVFTSSLNPAYLFGLIMIGFVFAIISSLFGTKSSTSGNIRYFVVGWVLIVGFNLLSSFTYLFTNLSVNLAFIAAASIVAINIIFVTIMRAPTIHGRKIMDQIDGFKIYLETAEKERLNMIDEPQMSVARFESILPYAIALGVEKPWSKHFESELARSAVADAKTGYQPNWYSSTNYSTSNLSKSMASMATGMSASMIAAQPSSSSSSGFSGGGGSSGGGGGGGGGGGW